MSALSIQVPFPVFQDRNGQPLDNGYVWIGETNLNPQTNPVTVYFDDALTIVAAQPLRTINGYVSNSGTPAQVYIDGVNFSILVQDSKGTMVYNFPDGTGIGPDACGVTYNPPFAGSVSYPVCEKLSQTISVKDFGAVGDNVNDDTAAIQAAITAAIGNSATAGNVFFPSGTYKVTGTLTIPNVVNGKGLIYGDGAQIKATHNGVLFDNQSSWVSFRDLTLSGPGKSNASSVGVQGTMYDWYFENVGVYDFAIGIRANGGSHLYLKCFFGGNGKCIWPSVFANIISIDSCYFSSSDYGLYVPNNFGPGPVNYVAQVCIYNTAMEVCATSVYSVGINRLLVENSWFEQETVGSLVLVDTPLLSINSNYVSFPPNISFTSGFPDASRRAQYLDPYTGETFRNYSTATQTSVNFDSQAYPNSGLDGISFTGYLAGNSYTSKILGGDNRINIDTPNFWPLADMTTYLGYTNRRWQDGYIARIHPGDATVLWTSGGGSPEGSVTAPVGSLYTNTTGGANTTLYIKESGSGNTGWVAK